MKISKVLSNKNWVAINLPLAKHLGLNAAFLFSHLCGLFEYYEATGQLVDKDGEMYFYATIDAIAQNTPLSRTEQATAIQILKSAGLIIQANLGNPCKRHFSIPLSAEKALSDIFEFAGNLQSSLQVSCNPVCRKPENQFAGNPQSSLQETRNNINKELDKDIISFSNEKESGETSSPPPPRDQEVIFSDLKPEKPLGEEKEKSSAKKEKAAKGKSESENRRITEQDVEVLKSSYPFSDLVTASLRIKFFEWLDIRRANKAKTPTFKIVKHWLDVLNEYALLYTETSLLDCLSKAALGANGQGWQQPLFEDKLIPIPKTTNSNIKNENQPQPYPAANPSKSAGKVPDFIRLEKLC